jgi:hypothetical protein
MLVEFAAAVTVELNCLTYVPTLEDFICIEPSRLRCWLSRQ